MDSLCLVMMVTLIKGGVDDESSVVVYPVD